MINNNLTQVQNNLHAISDIDVKNKSLKDYFKTERPHT